MYKKMWNANVLKPMDFIKRLLKYLIISLSLISLSLLLGVLGYHYIANLSWIDSLYNASLILTGMGPVDKMETVDAKLFASVYALFSGVAFLSTVAIFIAPIAHRLLHILHVDTASDTEEEKQ